jgi:threonylcarbamoyladenosine tRNA methylthiotransferase CDKAL1
MRVRCETYGCTMNKGDSELMLGRLTEAGHRVVDYLDDADLVLVNTCAVKGPTQRRVLRRLEELRQLDGKKIVVAGCLPLIDPKSIDRAGIFEGVISCHATDSIVQVVDKIAEGKTNVRSLQESSKKLCAPKLRGSEVSAIVPISEGCTSNCSYCSVKFARGKLRSFNLDEVLAEIEDALRSGRREILLTAQDTAAYGMDSDTLLPELLEKITQLDGKFRVRVGMMNPTTAKPLMPELVDAFDDEKIYKFLHLPVQSGDDGVLREMRRGYTVEEFLKIVNAFRERFRNLYLATDVIVGFPGEEEAAFENTCELIERAKPDKVNLTRFSPMPGTDAARMPQVEGREKKRRSRLLSAKHRAIGHEQNKGYVGRTAEGLIVEEGKKGGWVVRLPNYKPAIVKQAGLGKFANVRITDARPTYLMGEVVGVSK